MEKEAAEFVLPVTTFLDNAAAVAEGSRRTRLRTVRVPSE
jgi:hypothetical protein